MLESSPSDRSSERSRESPFLKKGSRVSGTCQWIKRNTFYNSWLTSDFQLLWLSGGPGKERKIMLSIYIAQELEEVVETPVGHSQITFLQYFCDNKDEKCNTAVAIVKGFLFQLLRSHPKMYHYTLPSFKDLGLSLFTKFMFGTLWRIFEQMLQDPVLGSVYCVLDGLDECEPDSSENLLARFKTLFNGGRISLCRFHLLITSREHPKYISRILSSFPRIRLDFRC